MLKTLVLRMKLNQLNARSEALKAERAALEKEETEIRTAFDEVTAETSEEERTALEAMATDHDAKAADLKTREDALAAEIKAATDELDELEAEQEDEEPATQPEDEEPGEPEERSARSAKGRTNIMNRRTTKVFGNRTEAEIRSMLNEKENAEFLTNVREAMANKREIGNAGLLIGTSLLGVIRENVERFSKLYNRVTVRRVSGNGREIISGAIPEAVWTECCANLNEATLNFNQWEVGCFKIGAYIAVCNATLEDSDIDLATEILEALAAGIAKGLDKAIVAGRNTTANSKMPLGIMTSLLQTAAPSDYPTVARAWEDLHSTHVVAVSGTGATMITNLVAASAVASSEYSRGELTWILNDKTYKKIVAESAAVNAAGAIVAAANGSMPVVGGDFVVLNFMPDDVIVFGYLDDYILADRAGVKLNQSEHARFVEDQTVFKGNARYDGAPVIREAFGIATLSGATASATAITFPQDTANPGN